MGSVVDEVVGNGSGLDIKSRVYQGGHMAEGRVVGEKELGWGTLAMVQLGGRKVGQGTRRIQWTQ